MSSYVRPHIEALAPYQPGEQPDDGQVVKLNTNENPYPPAAVVLAAIRAVGPDALRRYPPPTAAPFRAAAAAAHGVSPDMVIATNGGDELLRMAITVCCRPGESGGGVAMSDPTYSLYATLAAIHDTPVVRIPLGEDFALAPDFARRACDAGCRLAILVNPHAPSGALRPLAAVRGIAEGLAGHALLLVDEAYVDFAPSDGLDLLRRADGPDNVLLLRTLSKGYSLAGLRFGYGIGPPALITALDKVRDSYNTDVVAQAAACAALSHRDEAATTWRAVSTQRDRLTRQLAERGFEVLPSSANFLLVRPPAGLDAASLYASLKRRGILVRYFDQARLRDRLRITVGAPGENDALLASLEALGAA